MKVSIALMFLMLAACTDRNAAGTDSNADADADADATARATGDADATEQGVFEPLTDTLDRARGVQDTVFEADAERRRQIDAASGR